MNVLITGVEGFIGTNWQKDSWNKGTLSMGWITI